MFCAVSVALGLSFKLDIFTANYSKSDYKLAQKENFFYVNFAFVIWYINTHIFTFENLK